MTPMNASGFLFFVVLRPSLNISGLVLIDPPEYHPDWTKKLFTIVFGGYKLVTNIVLVKLLIATMSDTYHKIQGQSDVEWKFGLSKLVRSIQRTTSTAYPLNLITIWSFYLKDVFVRRIVNRKWRKLSSRSKGSDESKFERKTSVVSKKFKRGFYGTPTSYDVTKKSIEHVVEWAEVTKLYRSLMEVGEKMKRLERREAAKKNEPDTSSTSKKNINIQ